MSQYGLTVRGETGGRRIEVECMHQNGLIYVVPGEASWVCTDELRHAHALAGFFRQLVELDDPRVHEAMQRWGIYFRPRPLAAGADGDGEAGPQEGRGEG